jgi:oxygen-dependent protoporphyrinogen oxidase
MKVVVVGGGIAGLAAARGLEWAAARDVDVVLVESDDVLGGKIRTERVDGFVIEAAPDSFLSRKERGVGLCEELGLGDQLIGRRPENHRSFVRRGRDLHPLPEGLTGMIPTNLDALERSALLSDEGKARFAAEVDVPAASGDEDESVASFVTRRFGREAYVGLVEPLMTGIYGGDGELLSLRATFPQLRVLELEHGSLLRSLPAQSVTGDRPPFVSLRGGMDTLVAALVASLGRTKLLLGRPAQRVFAPAGGYDVELADGETIRADGVVVATPAFVTAALLEELDADLAAAHAEIPYASSVVITLAFSAQDVAPLDGYGYVIPRTESRDVLACTWSSQKWEGRAPAGDVLVRIYAGRFGGRDLTLDSDDELGVLARAEMALLGVIAEPALIRIQRWPLGMPQYVLGHLERLGRVDGALAEHPGLAVAGAAYRGVGIPDCIRSGEAAAVSVVRALAGAGV